MSLKYLACALWMMLFTFSSLAQSTMSLSPSLVELINQKKLHQTNKWLGLLAYKSIRFRQNSYKSDVLSKDFFVAPDGATNPQSELYQGVYQLLYEKEHGDDAYQCRFPARSRWLIEQLDFLKNVPKKDCESFQQWRGSGSIDSATLIYATGYMSNPASFFGHMLLKFNDGALGQQSQLLDTAINYGAKVPANENMAVYALKGLFGFYEASYSQREYYTFNHQYTEEDLRDVWLYDLSLSNSELEELIGIVWERLGKTYQYFYLRQNCAYRMAELIETVTAQPLRHKVQPWVIPSDIFNRLVEADGSNLVTSYSLQPSRLNNFYTKYMQLTNKQTEAVATYINSQLLPTDLSAIELAQVYETLFDYYEYLNASGNPRSALEAKKTLLLERMKLTVNFVWGESKSLPLHEGPKPGMIRAVVSTNSDKGLVNELILRAAYYDYLALAGGRVPNSELIMGRLTLALDDSELRFKQFDVLSIETLNVSQTGLPNDGGMGWRIGLGWQPLNNSCTQCVQAHFDGGVMKGWRLGTIFTSFTSINASVFENRLDSGYMSLTVDMGLMGAVSESWQTRLVFGYDEYLSNNDFSGKRMIWSNRFGRQRNWDFRANYEYDGSDTFSIGFSKYW